MKDNREMCNKCILDCCIRKGKKIHIDDILRMMLRDDACIVIKNAGARLAAAVEKESLKKISSQN